MRSKATEARCAPDWRLLRPVFSLGVAGLILVNLGSAFLGLDTVLLDDAVAFICMHCRSYGTRDSHACALKW